MSMLPSGSTAVMARRVEPPDSLDFFPTPPWATRALFKHVLHPRKLVRREDKAWDPCCGEMHMVVPLQEEFDEVRASDIFPYSPNQPVMDVLGYEHSEEFVDPTDWFFFNPPFNVAEDFVRIALKMARKGICALCRSGWAEGVNRYNDLFGPFPPAIEALFVERVPMVKGRWDPDASTATAYSWFIWLTDEALAPADRETRKFWIPPGNRKALTTAEDIRRFVPEAPLPLFAGAAS